MEERIQDLARSDEVSGVSVHAGFPNPAADRQGAALSLDRLLLKHPSSNFIFRVRGHNWADRGIFDGDLALIDRALDPARHNLVIAWQDDSFIIDTLANLPPGVEPWGTLTALIHEYRKETT